VHLEVLLLNLQGLSRHLLQALHLTLLDLSPQALLRAPDISLRHRLPADPRVLLRLPLDIHHRHRAVALGVLRSLLGPNHLDMSAAVPRVPLPLRPPDRPHPQVAGPHLLHDLRRFLLDPGRLSLQAVHPILVHPPFQGLQSQRVLRTPRRPNPPGLQVAHIILRRHHQHRDRQDRQAQLTLPLLDLLAPQAVHIIRPRDRLPQDRPLTHLDLNPQFRQAARSPNHRDLDPRSLAALNLARLILLFRDLLFIVADLHRHLRGHHLEVAHQHLKARDIRAACLLQVLPDHLTLQAPLLIHRLQRALQPHQVRLNRQFLKVLARRVPDLRAAFLLRVYLARLTQPVPHRIRRLLRAAAPRLHHRALDLGPQDPRVAHMHRVFIHLTRSAPPRIRPRRRALHLGPVTSHRPSHTRLPLEAQDTSRRHLSLQGQRLQDQRVAVRLPQYTPTVLRPQVRRAVFTAACLNPAHRTHPLAAPQAASTAAPQLRANPAARLTLADQCRAPNLPALPSVREAVSTAAPRLRASLAARLIPADRCRAVNLPVVR